MKKKSKYRVKVIVKNALAFGSPRREYVIQKRTLFGWINESDSTIHKNWAYETCEEMNTDYETIRAQRK
jgi:hypothetical protein